MYHVHFRSTITVRDSASSFPCCNEFRYSHAKDRLIESVCACGLRLSNRSPAGKVAFLGGCGCCQSQFDGFLAFRLRQVGGARRIASKMMNGDGFSCYHEFDWGVEFYDWVQEIVSLLVRFDGGISPVSGNSRDFHHESSLLPCVHNNDAECESSFRFKRWSFSEDANGDDDGPTGNVDMVVGRRNRSSDGRSPCDDNWEDNDPCYESGLRRDGYSSSLKGQQGMRESLHEFSVQDKHFTSDSKRTQRHGRTETETESSMARGRYKVTKDEAESSMGASSVRTTGDKQQEISGDGCYWYTEEERNKRQEIVGGGQYYLKSDEIKVCLDDKKNHRSCSSASVSRHEEQIGMKLADSVVGSRNVIGGCSGSVRRSSCSYGTDQSHVDGLSEVSGDAIMKRRHPHEIEANDNVTELDAALSDAHYTYGRDQKVSVIEREETSTSVHNSVQSLKQIHEKTVGEVAAEPVSRHPGSSVVILDTDVSRLHVPEEYATKHHHSSNIDYLQQASTSSVQLSARNSQERISTQKKLMSSSSETPVGSSLTANSGPQTVVYATSDYVAQDHHSSNMKYMQELSSNVTQTGARISEPVTLQDKPRPHPSQWPTETSLESTGAHQSGGSTTSHYVEERRDSEYSQVRDRNTRAGAIVSGQTTSQEISVPSQTIITSSPNGSSGYQLPGNASDNDIAEQRHSVNVSYLQEPNTNTQIGTTASGSILFLELPAESSSKSSFQGSTTSAGGDQSAGSVTNEAYESLQFYSDVVDVQLQGDSHDTLNQHSGPPTEDGHSSSSILLEKSPDGLTQPSADKLHPPELPSLRSLQITDATCLVERERSSQQSSTVLQQSVLTSPPSHSNGDSVQGNSSGNISKNSRVRSSRHSPASSDGRGPSDGMWDVSHQTFEERSNVEKAPEAIAISAATASVGAAKGIDSASLGKPIVKKSSRKIWSNVAEIIKSGWISRAGSHNSKSKSSAKCSTESGSSENWFSGTEPDDEESSRKKEKGMLRESRPTESSIDQLISVENVNQRQEVTDGRRLQATITDNMVVTASQMGLSVHGSVQGRASSILDDQTLGSAINSASTGSLSLSVSGRVSPALVARSTGFIDVQGQAEISEMRVSSLEIGKKNLDTGSYEPSWDRPKRDSNEDKKRALGPRKLERATQVQRDRFEAWEEAYRLETEQRNMDETFMREALSEAKKAADIWEVPVGAVLVQDGKIIARGHNLVEELRDSTGHAEMLCIREASRMLRTWRLAETTLYVTLEPCPMCAGAILQARIDTLVWGAPNKLLGADGSWVRLFPSIDEGLHSLDQRNPTAGPIHPFHPNMKIRRSILATECSDVMQQFFQLRRKKAKTPEAPSSLPVTSTPAKFFSKMHNILNMIFCL